MGNPDRSPLDRSEDRGSGRAKRLAQGHKAGKRAACGPDPGLPQPLSSPASYGNSARHDAGPAMLSTREPADAYGAPAATRIISRFTRSSFKTHVSLRFGASDPLSRGQQTFSCKGSDSTCLGPHRPDQPCSTSSALPLPWESAGGRCAGLGLVSAHQTTSGTRGRATRLHPGSLK